MVDLTGFFKNETIFSISLILAVISCFFVGPGLDYIDYISWDTVILLFVIMLIVEVLKNLMVFEMMVRRFLSKIRNTRQLVLLLVLACFFSSILITNDVSLIIFVPFALLTLNKINRNDLAIFTVCMQTIAANVGCMVLPIGAPHNIVLYTASDIPFESFFLLLFPYILVSLVFLIALSFFVSKDNITLPGMKKIEVVRKDFLKRVFCGVDYYLLLTFIALFVLIGNLEHIPFFTEMFEKWIIGNEVIFGVISSQIISNVPAAMLISGFSNNYDAIIVGINIGGFGSLIASMANLISYKILIRQYPQFKRGYLLIFTALNAVLLIVLLILHLFLIRL